MEDSLILEFEIDLEEENSRNMECFGVLCDDEIKLRYGATILEFRGTWRASFNSKEEMTFFIMSLDLTDVVMVDYN